MACQLEQGWNFDDFIGTYTSPASTAIEAGTFVEISSATAIKVADGVAVDDGAYILTQKVTTDGPSYQEIVNRVIQHEVKAGDPVTIVPAKKGAILRTTVIATGNDAGAITDQIATQATLGMAAGKLRASQGGDVLVAKLLTPLNADGEIVVEIL